MRSLCVTLTPLSAFGGPIKGDTLFGISKKTGASVSRIMSNNGLTSDMIRVGQTLRIP